MKEEHGLKMGLVSLSAVDFTVSARNHRNSHSSNRKSIRTSSIRASCTSNCMKNSITTRNCGAAAVLIGAFAVEVACWEGKFVFVMAYHMYEPQVVFVLVVMEAN